MIKQVIATPSWAYILQNFAIGRGHEHLFCLCQQYRLSLAPTRIHSLKLNFSLTQLGVVVATQLGKLTATGAVTNSRGGGCKKTQLACCGRGSQYFPPNKLKGMHGTQTVISTAVRPSKWWEIKKHFLAISTGICLSFDEISGNYYRMEGLLRHSSNNWGRNSDTVVPCVE